MNTAERQRTELHANLLRTLLRAHPTIRHGLTVMTLPDAGGTTWIAVDYEEEPQVTGLMLSGGTFFPPVPMNDELRDEMLEFVQSHRAGTLPRPTKEPT